MFRNGLATSSRRLCGLHSGTCASIQILARTPRRSIIMIATTTTVSLWYLSSNLVHNDSAYLLPSTGVPANSKRINDTGVDEDGVLYPVVWGSNKTNLIDPESPEIETFKTPVNAKWLGDIALRDMVLHERHAACIDARGDVFQWGDGFFGSKSDTRTPKGTLRGKNIIKLQLTESCVYALSTSGRIYVFAANEERQRLPVPRTASRVPWWASGWVGREQKTINFVEILPREKLNKGESFVSIAAGSNHLLALTSEGRTYTHPMNKDANSHGQLGLRDFKVPVPSGLMDATHRSHIVPEHVPWSMVDPYVKSSSPSLRESPTAVSSEHLNGVDNRQTRFSGTLFEIPSLRGIKVSQIAAGGWSSFVNTTSGRVLGWGANEHGQVGLGSGITLDVVTVPTEIDLTRNTPVSTKSRCLNIIAGGNLTYFVVERSVQGSVNFVDILACGDGQWGGLGNGSFSTFQGNPVRVKNVSGLREFDEQERRLSPIVPHAISVSSTGHVLLSLDTELHAGPGGSGRDLVTWGLNQEYQLGTGKRTSLNAPTTLESHEGGRFILAKRKTTVKDLSGRVWKRNVEVEQCAIAGYGSSVVYWKIRL